MKNFDVIAIPVAPHVQKFMNESYGEVYELSKNDQIGIMILAMLGKKIVDIDPELRLANQSAYYQISISTNTFIKEGFSLDFIQRKLIGKALDLYFRDLLFSHAMMNHRCFRHEIKQSIITYCGAFNITTDDIDPETLCRDIRRRKTANSPNLISKLSQFKPKKEG